MVDTPLLARTKLVGTGIAFIVFPLVFVLAFALHPGLSNPHFAGPEELVRRARHEPWLQFGHALVTLNTVFLVVAALHFMDLTAGTSGAWRGFVGAGLAILGALSLAADKGALCLTVSGLEGLSTDEFERMMPGLIAIFSKQGWLILLWGIVFLPLGFAIQALGLLRAQSLPRWQSVSLLVAVLFVATPDGMEIINLSASLLLAVAFVPYGFRLTRGRPPVHYADA